MTGSLPAITTAQMTSVSPIRKQPRWSLEDDFKIIQLRNKGLKWQDISKCFPGRTAASCRLHYQNYLKRRNLWDENLKNKLARLYERCKADMWAKIAEEMAIPWRAAEAIHWQVGESGMARRAGLTVFALAEAGAVGRFTPSRSSHRHSPKPYSGASHRSRVGSRPSLPSLADFMAGLPVRSPSLTERTSSDQASRTPERHAMPARPRINVPPPGGSRF